MKRPRRTAFSLLEVLLAIAILLGSAIVLAELAGIGTQHVTSAERLATAQRLCQLKLNEILAGITPLERVESQTLVDRPDWIYSVEIEPISRPGFQQGLAALRVTVAEDVEEDQQGRQFTLTRWIRDPYLQSDTEIGSDRRGTSPPTPSFVGGLRP